MGHGRVLDRESREVDAVDAAPVVHSQMRHVDAGTAGDQRLAGGGVDVDVVVVRGRAGAGVVQHVDEVAAVDGQVQVCPRRHQREPEAVAGREVLQRGAGEIEGGELVTVRFQHQDDAGVGNRDRDRRLEQAGLGAWTALVAGQRRPVPDADVDLVRGHETQAPVIGVHRDDPAP